MAVPELTPVTLPVAESTVAIAALLDDHVPPNILDEKKLSSPIHKSCLPFNVPAVGAAVIVTVRIAETLVQPPVPETVYDRVAVPTDSPVTSPEVSFIDAIVGLLDDQIPPDIEDENADVPPMQTSCMPLNVPAIGGLVTFIVREATAGGQLPLAGTV